MAISDREIPPFDADGPDRDRVLVAAHRAGDDNAFPAIVKDNYRSLVVHAMRRLNDARAAEDAVQETLLRAYRSLATFDGDYRLQAWLHRILTNVCHDEGARRRRESEANQRWSAMPAVHDDSVEDHAQYSEARLEVERGIAQLPVSYREALVLRDIYELEYADVASHAGITEQNARARVHRARVALRRLVERSAALGPFVWRGWRRATRWAPRVAEHVANSTAAVPDVVNLPSRTGLAVTAMATTSAAVAAVAAPLIGSQLSAPPAPRPPAAVVVSTPARVTTTSSARWPRQVTAATSSGVVVIVTTTTTAPPATTTVAPAPAVHPSVPEVVAALTSSRVTTDSNGGLTSADATLVIGSGSPIAGSVTTKLVLPAQGALACTGFIDIRFVWTDSSGPHELDLSSAFGSTKSQAGATTFALSGGASMRRGATKAFTGPLTGSGTLTVPSDGSDGLLQLSFVAANAPAASECLPGPATTMRGPGVSTSTVPATSTTVPSTSSTTAPASTSTTAAAALATG